MPGVFVVQACGEFDADEVDLLLAAWEEADELALPTTVVDLTGCAFGGSSFLGALPIARSRHLAPGRRLVLTRHTPLRGDADEPPSPQELPVPARVRPPTDDDKGHRRRT
ncbi:STAS domain-containing protein [Streptomyces rubiginosohelvolus]|uniref:STAS domain-containing protein n=1 Tax=Streptomyces rubiginosohelvolus TaxID=67362 RepID=UPI0033B0C676